MEVHFTPDQEAQLSLEEARRFHEGIERGIAAAERGEFVEQAVLWSNVEEILHC